MTTRTDVSVDYYDSPRVLEVLAPSVEMTMQDMVDTVRKQEDSFAGMSFEKLMNASGKEDLGGGVQVGITVSQQDMKLAFEGRTAPAETGTVSTNPGSPVSGRDSFTDTGATFIANNVARGSLVINFTDQSIAEVHSVDSETKLTTKTLVNGIGNTYDAADAYQVFNVIQCNATGGNLVAVNSVQASIPAILPTAFTQVVLTSSASATLTESQDIQYASFNGGVSIDVIGGTAGTVFPTGTERQPVSNFNDALTIAQARGFLTFYVFGDATIDSSNDYTDYRFIGQGQNLSTFTLQPNAIFVNATFMGATVTGTLDGDSHIEDCIIDPLTFVSGVIQNCILNPGTIILGGSSTAHFVNCASGVPGAGTPIIDCGGSGQDLALRNYNGGIEIANLTGADNVSIDMNSGQIILASSITNGTIICRGIGKVMDSTTGSAVVIDEMLDAIKLQEIWGRLGLDPNNPLTTNDDNSISFAAVLISAINGATSTTQTRAP